MSRWYVLPNSFRLELGGYVYDPAHAQPIPADTFKRLMREFKKFVSDSVGGNKLPAHNPKLHFCDACSNTLMLFDLYYGARAKTGFLLLVRQMLEIAMYGHDCGHRGSTLRVDYSKSKFGRSMPLPLPELGNKVSVEYVSVLLVDQFLVTQKIVEISLGARLFIAGVIYATTFGHKAAVERGYDFIPNPQPQSLCYAMARVGDSQSKPDFKEAMDYGACVNFGEVPATGQPIPADPMVFGRAQRGYLSYCLGEQDTLDRIAGKALCAKFRKTTLDHANRLDAIIAGKDVAGMKMLEGCVKKWSK